MDSISFWCFVLKIKHQMKRRTFRTDGYLAQSDCLRLHNKVLNSCTNFQTIDMTSVLRFKLFQRFHFKLAPTRNFRAMTAKKWTSSIVTTTTTTPSSARPACNMAEKLQVMVIVVMMVVGYFSNVRTDTSNPSDSFTGLLAAKSAIAIPLEWLKEFQVYWK